MGQVRGGGTKKNSDNSNIKKEMDRAERKLARRRERGGSEVYGPVWLKDTVVNNFYDEMWRLSRELVVLSRRLFNGQARIRQEWNFRRIKPDREWHPRFVWPRRKQNLLRKQMREFGPVEYLY